MTVETENGTVEAAVLLNGLSNGDLKSNPNNATKKSKESERCRRRCNQKKKNKLSSQSKEDADDSDSPDVDGDFLRNFHPNQAVEEIEIRYVAEKPELDDDLPEEFKKIFEKFSLVESGGGKGEDKKDEADEDAAAKNKVDSDSDEEEQDNQQKEKGLSNKKKKLQQRMKIAELKQICRRPDVVEIWDATASEPKLLVFLKSYQNTVPVPRHWCQKRKYLQGIGCD